MEAIVTSTWTESGRQGGFRAEMRHHLNYERTTSAVVLKTTFKGSKREARGPTIQEKRIVAWAWEVVVEVLRGGRIQAGCGR